MDEKHEVISLLKRLQSDLGRSPKRDDLFSCDYLTKHRVMKAFGTFTEASKAAGFLAEKAKQVPKKFKYKKTKLDSLTIHEVDLREWFRLAGEPPVLKVLAQPDTHVENMDHGAVATFLTFAEHWNPDVHIIMGDFLDAKGISHWQPDDRAPKRIVPEIIKAKDILKEIVRSTPKAKSRVYITGNHEDWIEQAFVARLPELFDGLDELGLVPDLKALLQLDKFGYDLIPINHFLKVGHAFFTHGLYTTDNHPKKHLDILKKNIYYGHLHDTKSYNTGGLDGPMEAQSLGCLCKLDAPFLKGKPNNWVHAFGLFEFFPDGTYTFYCPKMINGRMAYNGKVFGD